MEDEAQLLARRRADLNDLLSRMDSVSPREALSLLDHYVQSHEASLYQEIGRLTRQVHDVLASFQLDRRVMQIAEQEIPDAKERLNYVIQLTEQATQKVIDSIEMSIPMAAGMQDRAEMLIKKWKTFSRREMNANEFRILCRENDAFLQSAHDDASKLKAQLTEMLMAQEFQDLTGQMIRRVIQLVQEVEHHLVELVRMTGGKRGHAPAEEAKSSSGPAVPGVDANDNRVNSQDDVDGLLSSLGF